MRLAATVLGLASLAAVPASDGTFDEQAARARAALARADADDAEALARGLVARAADPARVLVAHELLAEALLLGGHATQPETAAAVNRALTAVVSPLDQARLQALMGRVLADRRDLAPARHALEASAATRRALLPACAPDLVASRQELASVRLAEGDEDNSGRLLDEARACDADLPPVARARTRALQSRREIHAGRYETGLRLAEEARALRAQEPGDAPGAIDLLNLLGELAWYRGDFDASRRWHEQALDAAYEALGESHPTVGVTLADLGHVERSVGNPAEALRLHETALAIALAARGEDHPETLDSRQNLANLYQEQDDYPRAEEEYGRVLELTSRRFGRDSDEVANVLLNQGVLWNRMGQPERARPSLERALAIWEASRGRDHAFVARTLDVLATALVQQGEWAAAADRLERSASIRRGPDALPLDLAWTLARLGSVRRELGQVDEARRLAEEAFALTQRSQGSDEARIATLGRIGELEIELGRVPLASARLQSALDLAEARLGRQHPQTARLRATLAGILLRQGRHAEAFTQATRAEETRRLLLRRTLRYLAEGPALRFAARPPAARDVLLSIAAGTHATAAEVRGAFEAVVQSRALVLDEMASRRAAQPTDAQDALAVRLAEARQRLAGLVYAESDTAREGSALAAAADELEELERRSAAGSAETRQGREPPPADLAAVSSALPEGTGLVSFVRFRAVGGQDEYLAFVLRGRTLAAARLGPAAPIDEAIRRWRDTLVDVDRARADPEASERASREPGRALARLLWAPLRPHLRGMDRVVLVPDGPIALVSFAAMPVGERYVVETGPTLHYVSSERDLLRPAPQGPLCPLLAVGAPDYDADGTGAQTSGALHFDELRQTGYEAQDVAGLWKGRERCPPPEVLLGRAAREGEVRRRAPGQAVLHLATHGFFARPEGGAAGTGERGAALQAETTRVLLQNPLLESGLAFAGANDRAFGADTTDDGLLTAAEVAGLDLTRARSVVLSACGSGVGRVQAGEGVMSLQRAFAIAGASTVVMALWAVDDKEARLWMRTFYEARLLRDQPTPAAVREAHLQVLRRLRREKRAAPPALWAAFVATGDWR